jgi:hypothetical protein
VRPFASRFSLALLMALLASALPSQAEDRIQLWQYRHEAPLNGASPDPVVESVVWREGDVEILFSQGAPCGSWMPVNPVWTVHKFRVVLNFTWVEPTDDPDAPTGLCKKFVRAWVFRVPEGNYHITFGRSVQRFSP